MVRILHVTECYGGGVGHALDTRVRATPEHQHHLLWTGDEDPLQNPGFSGTTKLPDGLPQRVRAVVREVKRLRPDIVHAHSSWAGVYTRVLPLHAPVVYEAHCFKFDDPALPSLIRTALWAAERALAPRARVFGTLSAHEDALARSLSAHAPLVRIPNVPTVPIAESSDSAGTIATRAVMMGRIVAQKDPAFFVGVCQELRRAGSPLEPVWVGDGDEEQKRLLRTAGVRVTGWLQPAEIVRELDTAVYVHTARYEGFPLSVLNAAARRCPIAARHIPALAGTTILQAQTPAEIADLAIAVSVPGERQTAALRTCDSLLDTFSVARLHTALNVLYESAIEKEISPNGSDRAAQASGPGKGST